MKTVSYSRLMRHIILSIFTLTWAFPLVLRAKELNAHDLNREFRPIRSLIQLETDFSQTRKISKWQTEIHTSGQLKVIHQPPKSMEWVILQPSYMALKMENSQLYTKSSKTAQWKILEKSKSQKYIHNLLIWMSFDGEKIAQHFHVKREGDHSFNMTPKSQEPNFNKMKMTLHKNKMPKEFILYDKTGDEIQIKFTHTKVIK